MYAGEESGKSCCGVMVTQTVSIRWFIVMIAFVGICCAVVGTVLGAMRSSGREHLTVSLLMIGKLFIAIIDQTRTIEKIKIENYKKKNETAEEQMGRVTKYKFSLFYTKWESTENFHSAAGHYCVSV
jgi:hypothetical protein